jgi:hypothetical protein
MIYIVYVLARDEWLKICGNECGGLIVSPLLLSLNYTAKELANKSIANIIKSPPQLYLLYSRRSRQVLTLFLISCYL